MAHRPVVHERYRGGGHLLSDLAGEDRNGLGDVIGLQPVTTGLVEEHAAATAFDDNGHGPRRRRSRLQLAQGATRRRTGELFDVMAVEQLEAHGRPDALRPGLHPGVATGNDRYPELCPHLVVGGQHAL